MVGTLLIFKSEKILKASLKLLFPYFPFLLFKLFFFMAARKKAKGLYGHFAG
jgi:hypothetical protein